MLCTLLALIERVNYACLLNYIIIYYKCVNV